MAPLLSQLQPEQRLLLLHYDEARQVRGRPVRAFKTAAGCMLLH
jgi:hypothetical protein